jgi:hypothetical protein
MANKKKTSPPPNKKPTALQQLKAKQKESVARAPTHAKKQALRKRHASDITAFKKSQDIVRRARKAEKPKARKKIPNPTYQSPATIKRRARKLKEEGAKLAPKPPRNPLLHPLNGGHVTRKCFNVKTANGRKSLVAYMNRIFVKYENEGGLGQGDIRAYLAEYEMANGNIASTMLQEPDAFTEADIMLLQSRVRNSDPTMKFIDMVPVRVCIVISWRF